MCVEATGDLCGAVYLDEGFDSQIRTLVGSSFYNGLDEEVKAKVFDNDWEFNAKRKYNGPGNRPDEFSVDIPNYKPKRSMPLFGRRPTSTIILKSGHMNAIFQPIIDRIVDLVHIQVSEVEEKTSRPPKAILLIGGFGESNFLLNQLKANFSKIPIQRPMKAWGVISRGAVLKGLSTSAETETVTNFISKLSYGVRYVTEFNHSIHDVSEKYRCPLKNIDMARNQFKWYLKRGQSVSKLNPVRHEWAVSLKKSQRVRKSSRGYLGFGPKDTT